MEDAVKHQNLRRSLGTEISGLGKAKVCLTRGQGRRES